MNLYKSSFTVLKDDLLKSALQLEETHISWVFLGKHDVWKVKKPVNLGFLDFTTPEKRRTACEAEASLNRRLSPDVYLGVVSVTLDADGQHRFGGDESDAVDWAVHMRRLPDRDRADVRIKDDRLTRVHVEAIAERLARFHSSAKSDEETARFGTVEAIRMNVEENFAQTRDTIHQYLTPIEAHEIEDRQRAFLRHHGYRFRERLAMGRIRDGHGDLRLDQMYIDDEGGVQILDCIEFNERFRYADVCADVAFFAMDLSWHGRADLAERFLARYARESGDYDLYPLVDFYESYRAFVRGKVLSILAGDENASKTARAQAEQETRRYYLLALAAEKGPVLPRAVVAVGGIIASGKSTVGAQLAYEMGTAVIDTDRTRKNLLGLDPHTPLHHDLEAGAYAPEITKKVYQEVFRRANAVLESGRGVVIDGSFTARSERGAARRLATAHDLPFYFVECRASEAVLRDRLRQRETEVGVSDGRLELLSALARQWEPAKELDPAIHLLLDTSTPLEQNIDKLRGQVPTWPLGMTD